MYDARQLFAIGGIFLLGAWMLPGDPAYASGQQWRGTPAYVTGHGQRYRPMGSVPLNRHRYATPAPRYRMPPGVVYPPMPARTAPRSLYQAPRMAAPWGMGYGPPQRYATAGYTWPGAAPVRYPMRPVGPAWRAPAPLFTRQFAWRPAGQPWLVPTPSRWQARPPAPVTAQVASFRPTGPAYGARMPTWRAGGMSALERPYTGPRSVVTWPRSPGIPALVEPWRSMGPPVARAPVMPPVGPWWPAMSAHSTPRSVSRAFGPFANGRTLQPKRRFVSRPAQGSDAARDGLPGWVTTYEDTAQSAFCRWCDGG